ncbi:hypothetical protein BD410DRAFT_871023 [Rickenella mellea]|uniref:Uncharacterized protein n=1 Tax=Rickenella mellea TaxID=50990 RepID=A0A4Y7Q0P2_9AGAM|nr:hypothetical protein BD410DRAFT_871023 [Rickenella mellea]
MDNVDAVKRYSYLLGQTEFFFSFILFITPQRARDPEYTTFMDPQPRAKGRGCKKANGNVKTIRHRNSDTGRKIKSRSRMVSVVLRETMSRSCSKSCLSSLKGT